MNSSLIIIGFLGVLWGYIEGLWDAFAFWALLPLWSKSIFEWITACFLVILPYIVMFYFFDGWQNYVERNDGMEVAELVVSLYRFALIYSSEFYNFLVVGCMGVGFIAAIAASGET
jgi:hypothetical protein